MKRSAATWKRVAMSLRGLKEQSRCVPGQSNARRQLRVERLQPREMLAADTLHEPALQYTGGITVAGEVASPDVNADGQLDPLDALVIANALNDQWGVEQLPAADLNQDQQLDGQDFAAVVQALQQQGNLVAAPAGQAELAAMGDGTVLDDRCAANEITIAMLQGHVDVLRAELEQTVDPTQRAFLEANIASLESSIASLQEDMNCGGGGEGPGQEEGGGTAGSEGTGGSSGTAGSEGTTGSGGSGGDPADESPSPPPADPPDEPTGETPLDPPPGDPVDPLDPETPTEPGEPPQNPADDPSDGPTDQPPADPPPLPPSDPDIPPQTPGDMPPGDGTDGTLGDTPSGDIPPTDIPPDDTPPADDPPGEIPPDEIPPGDGTLGDGGNTGATEFYVKELKLVPLGYSQGEHGSKVPPLYEGSLAEVRGKIDGPRHNGILLPPPDLTLQADLNSDGDFDDPFEQTRIDEFYLVSDETVSGEWVLEDQFYWTYSLPDDGPVPGDGEASNHITVRAFFGELDEPSADGETTNNYLPPEQAPSPDEMPEPPEDEGPKITWTSAEILNIDPYWTRPPELTWQVDEDGHPVAQWGIGYDDVGKQDAHKLQVRWGEGPAELLDVQPEDYEQCDEHLVGEPCPHGHTVLVMQQVPAESREAESVTLTVADDDTGAADYTILNLNVIRNNDDDDFNHVSDLLEPGHESEDDLKRLRMSKLLTDEMKPQSDDYRKGEFQLLYDPKLVRVWDSAEKKTLILPYGLTWKDVTDNTSRLPTNTSAIPYTGQSRVWVEGISPSKSQIRLHYVTEESPGAKSERMFAGHALVTVWGVDADIDSDNSNNHAPPDRSDWEEYLEDSEYAIGKLLYMEHPDGIPLQITLTPGLDPADDSVLVRLSHPTPFQSGHILVWRESVYEGVVTNLVVANGNVEPVSEDISSTDFSGGYNLKQLGYDPATGRINLFINLLDVASGHNTKRDVDRNGKPNDRIRAELVGTPLATPSDEVKWMGVRTFDLDLVGKTHYTDSFYNFVNTDQPLRNAFAAEMVYGDGSANSLPTDRTKYPMKWVSREREDLLAILDTADGTGFDLTADEKRYLLDMFFYREQEVGDPGSRSIPGLGVGLYLDHVSGNYVLAFRGTNPDQMVDWIENVSQLVASYSPQYRAAIMIAAHLKKVPMLNDMQITGHSLGGGLASAAAIVTSLHADTFNSSGLVKGTLLMPVRGVEYEPDAFQRFEHAEQYVNSFQVYWAPQKRENGTRDAPDVLSYLQNHMNIIKSSEREYLPDAKGERIAIEGIHDLTDREMSFVERLSNFFRQQEAKTLAPLLLLLVGEDYEGTDIVEILETYFNFDRDDAKSALSKMIDSHGFDSIYNGLVYRNYLTPPARHGD